MDFWDLTRLVFRRWYVAAPMLLLTIGAATWTVTGVEPDYIATAHVQLVTPSTVVQTPTSEIKKPTEKPRNPWLDLGLGSLSAAGAVTVQDQSIIKQLEAADLSSSYTITQGNGVPLVSFEVVGETKEQATKTVDYLTGAFDKNVAALQDEYGAPETELITTRRLDMGSNVTESNSKVKRALVAVAGVGVLLTAALTIGLDALLRRRSRRKGEPVPALSTAAPRADTSASASSAVPVQRNGSAAGRGAQEPARDGTPAGERSELDRTVIISQPTVSRARSMPLNGGAEAKNGSGGGAVPPTDATIVLPNNIYGGVPGRRGENKDRR